VDSLPTDVTLLTIGGEEKAACRASDELVQLPDGQARWHGRFSWLLGQALLQTAPASSWIAILSAMEQGMTQKNWEQPLLFHGQPTRSFGG
jgi:hypothetical protein